MSSPREKDGEMPEQINAAGPGAVVPGMRRANTSRSRLEVNGDPWRPIVLSLDGGGIRGLSELFIMRKILERIQELIDQDGDRSFLHVMPAREEGVTLLPCYFFDYMIGTSTGGLVAVMLGRLRMSVDDSIKAYWRLGNYIFWPRRFLRLYSSKRLRRAIIRVIEDHCGCRGDGVKCPGDMELLRQYDYAELNDASYREHPERLNFTCKVALVAQKKELQSQVTHLLRSYNHSERFENDRREFNPGTLGRSTVKIWEACRATSAAPYYFRNMTIGPDEFLDGGAGNNNPSNIAWNEAKWMSGSADPHGGEVAVLLSLGCGEKESLGLFGNQKSLFYVAKVLKHGRNEISNTKKAHDETQSLADSSGSAYFRFSVKPVEGDRGNDGLSAVKLSECKRRSKNPRWNWIRETAETIGRSVASLGRSSSWPPPLAEVTDRPAWYTQLLDDAAKPRLKGGLKPDKYSYTTYETIFDRTQEYCVSEAGGEDVARKINECASVLLRYARARQQQDLERRRCFISHPNPSHRDFLPSQIRPEAESS